MYTDAVRERFWAKVDRKGEEECWEWLASKFKKGYGRFHLEERRQQAHRVSFALHHGAAPADLCVCHRCDNPSCVNPAHLFLGTNEDNVRDKVRKNRQARGECLGVYRQGMKSGQAKLTDAQVQEIRANQETQKELSLRMGVSQSLISMIQSRKRWRHIP